MQQCYKKPTTQDIVVCFLEPHMTSAPGESGAF